MGRASVQTSTLFNERVFSLYIFSLCSFIALPQLCPVHSGVHVLHGFEYYFCRFCKLDGEDNIIETL